MENEKNCQTSTDTDTGCHADGTAQDRERPRSIAHSISPGVHCPETVLVAVMSNGSYLLVGYPQSEPTAFVIRDDAGPLRQALEGAFGNPTDGAVSGNGSSNGTVVSECKTLGVKQARQ